MHAYTFMKVHVFISVSVFVCIREYVCMHMFVDVCVAIEYILIKMQEDNKNQKKTTHNKTDH